MQREFKPGRQLVLSLPKDSDPIVELREFCQKENLQTAFLWGIGALTRAVFGVYDPQSGQYHSQTREEFLEILNCTGNISLKEGKTFPHLHITLADKSGQSRGGHLMEGSRVFAGEFFLLEPSGAPLVREFDAPTGLSLWQK